MKTQIRMIELVVVIGVILSCGLTRADLIPDMALIPAASNNGTNLLGAGESYNSILYPATYSLTVNSFLIGKYEVTKAQWDGVFAWGTNNGYSFDNAGNGKTADHPVQNVNWYDVLKWCNARSEKEGMPVSYRVGGSVYRSGRSDAVTCDTNSGYRLPKRIWGQIV